LGLKEMYQKKLKKGIIIEKTFVVDWSSWLEKLFLKIFRKKGGD